MNKKDTYNRHINAYTFISRTSCASTCTYTPFHQCTCRRRSCSCCQLSRRLRSSLGSQTQWLTRLAKFNMGVSIYPDPTNNRTRTHVYGQKDRKRGKVRGQVWLQRLLETKGQDRVKLKNEGETERTSWSCSEILTDTLLSSSPSEAETETCTEIKSTSA